MGKSKKSDGGMFDQVLGPDYDYSAQIKTPQELGMSADGNFNALTNDIGGIIDYVKVLVTGQGNASRPYGPLGSKFFLQTAVKCTDLATNKDVKRSVYINNVPDGSIPLMSSGGAGVQFDSFLGLIPGLMSNLAQINPMQILSAFTDGSSPTCHSLTMETIDDKNVHSSATGYITNSDIDAMPNSWFTIDPRPDTTEEAAQQDKSDSGTSGFTTMQSASSLINEKGSPFKNYNTNYSKMPNDFLIRLYYSSLGLLGLYFFLKIMLRKRLRG